MVMVMVLLLLLLTVAGPSCHDQDNSRLKHLLNVDFDDVDFDEDTLSSVSVLDSLSLHYMILPGGSSHFLPVLASTFILTTVAGPSCHDQDNSRLKHLLNVDFDHLQSEANLCCVHLRRCLFVA